MECFFESLTHIILQISLSKMLTMYLGICETIGWRAAFEEFIKIRTKILEILAKKKKRVRDLLLQDDPNKMPKLTIFFCCIRAQNPRKDKAEKDAYLRRQQKGFELSLYVN